MPADRVDAPARRTMVPPAAGRSMWFAAAWTGLAPVLIGTVAAIAAVAVCWLPASGADGNAGSAIRAGVLTFLAALHGGITVDGVPADFVPLGMTLLVALLAWRAGSGLADAAADLGDQPRRTLLRAAALQAVAFAAACGLAARLSPLGTSEVSVAAAGTAGLLLFSATGTVAFVRASGLADGLPAGLRAVALPALRAAAAGVTVYLGCGALLVAASLLLHRERVELLSQQVGGGWSGAPVLLLGILAAPNAAIAGASYLAGPGFAVGSGSVVSLGATVHGTLPAFPVLAAVPTGPANSAAWLLVAATPVAAGLAVVRVVRAAGSWRASWWQLGAAVVGAAILGLVLAWLGGGAIGSGRLSAVGASPWQFGLAAAGGIAAVAAPALAGLAAVEWWRGRASTPAPVGRASLAAVSSPSTTVEERAEGTDQLAG